MSTQHLQPELDALIARRRELSKQPRSYTLPTECWRQIRFDLRYEPQFITRASIERAHDAADLIQKAVDEYEGDPSRQTITVEDALLCEPIEDALIAANWMDDAHEQA